LTVPPNLERLLHLPRVCTDIAPTLPALAAAL
jgi:hypothetical protein